MKKLTKIISVILAVLVMASALSVCASAVSVKDGYFTYEIVNGEAILTKCDKTAYDVVVVPSYVKDYEVTEIAVEAFKDCDLIIEIIISEGIEVIGADAFIDCSLLEVVRLPKSLKKIHQGVFYCCDLISRLYYAGDYEDWCQIEIGAYNEAILEADTWYGIETQYGIYLEPEAIFMNYKDQKEIVLGADRDLAYVEWYSFDESVATVDENGKVTGVGTGSTYVCCYAEDTNGNAFIEECCVYVSFAWWQWLINIFLFGWIWY